MVQPLTISGRQPSKLSFGGHSKILCIHNSQSAFRSMMPSNTDPLRDTPVVLLSIDEQWANAILDGDKQYEYRRQPPAIDPPYRVVLYATGDVSAAVGGFETHTVVKDAIDELIDQTIRHTPHSPDDIQDYFEGKDEGSAIRVSSYLRYDKFSG